MHLRIPANGNLLGVVTAQMAGTEARRCSAMLQYVCDNCGAVKGEPEEWVLGFAAERLGISEARREITIAPRWDENRAVQWFAVHFCSIECKDEYIDRLFGTQTVSDDVEVVEHATVTPASERKTKITRSRATPRTATTTRRTIKKRKP